MPSHPATRPGALAVVCDRLLVCELKGERLQVLNPLDGAPLQLISSIGIWKARLGCMCADGERGIVWATGASPHAPLHEFELKIAGHWPLVQGPAAALDVDNGRRRHELQSLGTLISH